MRPLIHDRSDYPVRRLSSLNGRSSVLIKFTHTMTFRSVANALSRGFALGAAIPLIVLSLVSAAAEVPSFFDPCFSFGDIGGRSNFPTECYQRGRIGGTSQTIPGTIARLLLVQGVALYTAILGLRGVYNSRPRLILAASFILLLLTLPLIVGRAGLITLVCAGCFFLSYLFAPRVPRTTFRAHIGIRDGE
jgi:hypothetical protein